MSTTTPEAPAQSTQSKQSLVYLGPVGAGLGFTMSGLGVIECDDGAAVLANVRKLKEQREVSTIFIDEGLAAEVVDDIQKLNNEAVPVIVLLPNPAHPLNLTQQMMTTLVVQAVGSDILSN